MKICWSDTVRKTMKGHTIIFPVLICPGMHCMQPRMIRLDFARLMTFLLMAFIVLPTGAWAFSMELPLDCSRSTLCVVQNYSDHDPSEKYADYTCGPLSYDKHTGTDFRVSYGDMEQGVPVLAAADGTVRAVRDGEPEGEISLRGKAGIKGREAGNAVVVTHADGFETQYSHLKSGSVSVQPGQQVKAGQRLGLVGLSGSTEFPHLEVSVRHAKQPVDPFTGLASSDGCKGAREPLWSQAALSSPVLEYQSSGLLEAGFFTAPPKDTIAMLRRQGWIEGRADDPSTLVFGAQVFGPKLGDVWTLRLTGPDGVVLAETKSTQERDQAQAMRYIGKKKGVGWTPGRYRGELRLTRPGGEDVVSVVREIDIQ